MHRHEHVPVRVVSGVFGAGKTSALISWAQNRDDAAGYLVWVALDTDVRARDSFWLLFLHHLEALSVPVDADLTIALLDQETHGPRLPALLARQLERSGVLTLVVDAGAEYIDDGVARDIVRLVDLCPELRVVIATRQGATDRESVARLGDRLALVDPVLLAFSPAEARQLAGAEGITLDAQRAKQIIDATGGWAAAVHAAIRSASRDDDWVAGLAERLLDEVRTHPGYGALRVLGLADSIAPHDVMELGLGDVADDIVNELVLRGVATRDERKVALQPIIRFALQTEFEAQAPQEFKEAHRQWARHRLRHDVARAAYAHAVASEDWPLAARAYRRYLLAITERERRPATRPIPSAALRAQPILRFAVALDDLSNGRRARALQGFAAMLAVAQGRQLAHRTATIDDIWIRTLVMVSLRLLGQHEMARSALRGLTRMAHSIDDRDEEIVEGRSKLLTQGATTLILSGHLTEASDHLEEAGLTPLIGRPPLERARVLSMIAMVDALRGDIRTASAALAECDALSLPTGLGDSYTGLPAMVAGALVALERGDWATADAFLRRTDTHAPTTEFWAVLLQAGTMLEWHRQGAPAALGYLEQGMEQHVHRGTQSPFATHTLHVLRITLLIAVGRFVEAKEALAGVPQRRSRRWTLMKAYSELFSGDPNRANALAVSSLRQADTPRERIALLVIAAAASHRVGDTTMSARYAASASAEARKFQLWQVLTLIPKPEAAILFAGESDVLDAIRHSRTFPLAAASLGVLSARELVVLRQLIDDATIEQIAKDLSVSRNTVKSQLRAVYRKLGVNNRAEAVSEARRLHLL
ncbi:LuxR C-terminal-related transcriptional regulator [Microbacterium sp. NC79]|uniref:LuxR C-terminal-related transcriptional regulator n=1 Tax=Microbacterium sp. NC79 TaxID=2851009 RepID=UPI0020B76765|nr:LuxR C-terminal-related transcriptional regulator [Microbacterium sp. NC79]